MPWIMDSIHRVDADLLLRDELTTRSENLMQPARAGSHRRADGSRRHPNGASEGDGGFAVMDCWLLRPTASGGGSGWGGVTRYATDASNSKLR
jgi:hypothetical protein